MSKTDQLVFDFIVRCQDYPPMIEDVAKHCWVGREGAEKSVSMLRSLDLVTKYSPLRLTEEGKRVAGVMRRAG